MRYINFNGWHGDLLMWYSRNIIQFPKIEINDRRRLLSKMEAHSLGNTTHNIRTSLNKKIGIFYFGKS